MRVKQLMKYVDFGRIEEVEEHMVSLSCLFNFKVF